MDPSTSMTGRTKPPEDTPQPRDTLQFTVSNLLVAVTAIAVLSAFHISTAGIVTHLVVPRTFSGVAALLLIGLSCYFSWKRSDCSNAFWILVIAWHFALIDTLWRFISALVWMNGSSPSARWLLAKYGVILAGITLPVLCSIPAVHLIFSRIQKPLPSPNTWSAAAAMLAFVDIAIIGFGTVAILGVRILPGGVIDWSVVLDH